MILVSDFNKIEIKQSVIESLRNYSQLHISDKEAGGVLMGRALINNNFIISANSEPQSRDTRLRCFFQKNKHDHQKIVDSYWKASKGYINYLGEWHTHPESCPKPSSLDLEGWKYNLDLNKNEIFAHVFIIVGTLEIGIWLGIKITKTILNVGYYKI